MSTPPKSLASAVEQGLEIVREGRPRTGVVGAASTLLSGAITVFLMVLLGSILAMGGFLLFDGLLGAFVCALGAMVVVWVLRSIRPDQAWRHALKAKGLTVQRVHRGGAEVELRVQGPVAVTYRFAPDDDVVECLQLRCVPPLPTVLRGAVHTLRLGAPTLDGALDLGGSPAQAACITGSVRAALTALGRPLQFRQSYLQFALERHSFDVPADAFDALAAALATLARDLADTTPALLRISALHDSDAALFDAARACVVLLADAIEPRAAPQVLACVRACIAGDFDALLAAPLSPAQRSAICRGVFRSGFSPNVGFKELVDGARGLPDTEAGCIDAIGLLGAVESPAARLRIARLTEVGSLAAA
ncbi:MAG: hypothetical protein ACI9U2_002940, partial [Bradymonadia bacterium]